MARIRLSLFEYCRTRTTRFWPGSIRRVRLSVLSEKDGCLLRVPITTTEPRIIDPSRLPIETSHGRMILMSSDMTLGALQALNLSTARVRIESLFASVKNLLGGLAYHFWSKYLEPVLAARVNILAAIEKSLARHLIVLGTLPLWAPRLATLFGNRTAAGSARPAAWSPPTSSVARRWPIGSAPSPKRACAEAEGGVVGCSECVTVESMMRLFSRQQELVLPKTRRQGVASGNLGSRILFARILTGVVILICAEVFSGASLKAGLWHPWTLLVTYWLYFAHFFFFTTFAVHTGRTSLSSLYLWGVLFGLHESWITKVIWHGYSGDGKFVMGHIGPYGFSEISMVFIFHPVMSFILPLAVTCLLCRPLRRLFPELAWFTGRSKGGRIAQVYLVLSLAPVMAMNSGGMLNLAVHLSVAIILLGALSRLAQPAFMASDGRAIVVFGIRGFVGLCVYLALLYGVTYIALRPEGRPSVAVQLFTFVFYAVAVAGLWLHRRRQPLPTVPVEKRESRLVVVLFAVLIGLAFVCTVLGEVSVLYPVIALNFVMWTCGGFALTLLCVLKGLQERFAHTA